MLVDILDPILYQLGRAGWIIAGLVILTGLAALTFRWLSGR